jgi:hypothetical protein
LSTEALKATTPSPKPANALLVEKLTMLPRGNAEGVVQPLSVVALVGLTLTGCGLAHRDLQERAAALDAQSQAAGQACDTKFPPGNAKTAVARARCQMSALEIRRTITPNPDLLDSFIGTMISAAEQVQDGQLTIARANEVVSKKYSELIFEEQRRNSTKGAIAAEDVAATSWAANSPVSCTKIGANCF